MGLLVHRALLGRAEAGIGLVLGQEALDLWDLTVAYSKVNHLYELKTPKTDEDMAHIATVFTPYFEAREWESREKPAR